MEGYKSGIWGKVKKTLWKELGPFYRMLAKSVEELFFLVYSWRSMRMIGTKEAAFSRIRLFFQTGSTSSGSWGKVLWYHPPPRTFSWRSQGLKLEPSTYQACAPSRSCGPFATSLSYEMLLWSNMQQGCLMVRVLGDQDLNSPLIIQKAQWMALGQLLSLSLTGWWWESKGRNYACCPEVLEGRAKFDVAHVLHGVAYRDKEHSSALCSACRTSQDRSISGISSCGQSE